MRKAGSANAKETLLRSATELIRRNGYVATTVDDICKHGGVTKGAFFHHFESKEALAEACLRKWDCQGTAMEERAEFQAIDDPVEKVLGYMDFYIEVFETPKLLKSCLAGTTAQEVSETNPTLREAANVCFVNAEKRFKALLDEASKGKRRKLDTATLTILWIATMQGALVLCKASKDDSVIPKSLKHVREYIRSLFCGCH